MCSSSCSNISSSAVCSNSSSISSASETNDLKNCILKSKIFPLEKDFGRATFLRPKEQQALNSHFIPTIQITITLPAEKTLNNNHKQRGGSVG